MHDQNKVCAYEIPSTTTLRKFMYEPHRGSFPKFGHVTVFKQARLVVCTAKLHLHSHDPVCHISTFLSLRPHWICITLVAIALAAVISLSSVLK